MGQQPKTNDKETAGARRKGRDKGQRKTLGFGLHRPNSNECFSAQDERKLSARTTFDQRHPPLPLEQTRYILPSFLPSRARRHPASRLGASVIRHHQEHIMSEVEYKVQVAPEYCQMQKNNCCREGSMRPTDDAPQVSSGAFFSY